jgi:hypothetical protein
MSNKHTPEFFTDLNGNRQAICSCGGPVPCPDFIPGNTSLESTVSEWCDKIEHALSKNVSFDTFTQIYYDKFCEHLKRDNKR